MIWNLLCRNDGIDPLGLGIPNRCWLYRLGDIVAHSLASIGITKERATAIVGRDCGCSKRQAEMNHVGAKIAESLRNGAKG